jgi:hypothetical protein
MSNFIHTVREVAPKLSYADQRKLERELSVKLMEMPVPTGDDDALPCKTKTMGDYYSCGDGLLAWNLGQAIRHYANIVVASQEDRFTLYEERRNAADSVANCLKKLIEGASIQEPSVGKLFFADGSLQHLMEYYGKAKLAECLPARQEIHFGNFI